MPASRASSTAHGWLSVIDPVAVARAWALQLLLDGRGERRMPGHAAPEWVSDTSLAGPFLGRRTRQGPSRSAAQSDRPRLVAFRPRRASGRRPKYIAARRPLAEDENAQRSDGSDLMTAEPNPKSPCGIISLEQLLARTPRGPGRGHPDLNEAHAMKSSRCMRGMATPTQSIGGYLDRDLARSRLDGDSGRTSMTPVTATGS